MQKFDECHCIINYWGCTHQLINFLPSWYWPVHSWPGRPLGLHRHPVPACGSCAGPGRSTWCPHFVGRRDQRWWALCLWSHNDRTDSPDRPIPETDRIFQGNTQTRVSDHICNLMIWSASLCFCSLLKLGLSSRKVDAATRWNTHGEGYLLHRYAISHSLLPPFIKSLWQSRLDTCLCRSSPGKTVFAAF